MDRWELLLAIKEAEERVNQKEIDDIDRLRAEGNDILADMLHDPCKDEVLPARPATAPYDGHNKYRRHGKWTGYNQTTGEQKPVK
jgi:hypothetical protein